MRSSYILAVCLVATGLVVMVGCGDDDDDNPITPASGVGTIVVDPAPDGIAAPWILRGPAEEVRNGTADQTLTDLATGDYTLTWRAVTGYTTPAAETRTLAAGQTVTFTGVYAEQTVASGTIVIDQTPDDLAGAGWALTGPRSLAGSGDATLTEMPVGQYTLSWVTVVGYATPASSTQTLATGATVDFGGTYQEGAGPGAVLVTVPAGTFIMGSPTGAQGEQGRNSDEVQHEVTLTTSFLMQATEVTNGQYAELAQWALDHGHCTATSSSLRDALDGSVQELLDLDDFDCEVSFSDGVFTVDAGKRDHPVHEVTWFGAVAYCDWLSLREGLPRAYDHGTWLCNDHDPYGAAGYRLPTEAEWEYACRAGEITPFNTGSCLDAGSDANYNGTFPYRNCPAGPDVDWTVPVASYPANAWGLHDLHGNVWEWCNESYSLYDGDVTDPVGPSEPDDSRVLRGGAWYVGARHCRSAARLDYPAGASSAVGLRPVRSID